MTQYRLRIQLDAPLSVRSSRSRRSRSQVPSYVPAPTLRGALAGALDRLGVGKGEMNRLFGPNGIRTTRLVPAVRHLAPRAGEADHGISRPAPLTLRTCKRHAGFDGEGASGAEEPAHGVEDTLWASTRFALTGDAAGLADVQTCQQCGNVLKPLGGTIHQERNHYQTEPTLPKETAVHVGRDRRRRGASGGVLYAQQMIRETRSSHPVVLEAIVRGAPEDAKRLTEELNKDAFKLMIGTGTSRGLGRCTVRSFEHLQGSHSVEERLTALQKDLEENAPDLRAALPGDGPLITMTLETSAFFVDPWLAPNMSPAGKDLLQAATDEEASHAEALARLAPVHQIGRPDRLQAWNGLAGFPHATDQGLTAGSVLVFQAPSVDSALVEALEHIEAAGVGLRRELGFGTVRVCDPIHIDIHEHSDLAPAS